MQKASSKATEETKRKPYVGFFDLAVLDVLANARQIRLALALRSYPSSRSNEVYASWESLGRRSRLISPSGDVRNVRLIAGQLRDLGLLSWERRPWKPNSFTLMGALAEGMGHGDADTEQAQVDQNDADMSRQTDAVTPAWVSRTKSPTTPPTRSDEDEAVLVGAMDGEGIRPLRGDAVEAALEDVFRWAVAETENEPEPTDGETESSSELETDPEADAAKRPTPRDETISADLRARKFTYLIEAKPTKGGDNFRAWLGTGRILFVDHPGVADDLREHVGTIIKPDIRPGVGRDVWVLQGFIPAPTVEERKGQLFEILRDVVQGRKEVSALDDVAFDDIVVPGFASMVGPGNLIDWARKNKCSDDRLREVLDRLGMHEVVIPAPVPEPSPVVPLDASPERRATLDDIRASLGLAPAREDSPGMKQEPTAGEIEQWEREHREASAASAMRLQI
jgi:hypothetical protein